jgi:ABC-2 type transport system ATP-binding protein
MPDFAAEFADVSKTYRVGLLRASPRPAVVGVNLAIPAGSVFGLLGPNRAGKTTLIKLLLSLARATAGSVTRLGSPVVDRQTLGRVGYVHENHSFPKYLTAREVLDYYGALTLLPHETVRQRGPELLELVGLSDRADDPIRTFSKGMTQRLGIAQALLNDPDLLVLDEPTEGLDLAGRKLLCEIVADRREQGKTVIVVSHVLRELDGLLDRVAVLVAGRLTFDGPISRLCGCNGTARPLETALQSLYEGHCS